jgi:hypothetical protein
MDPMRTVVLGERPVEVEHLIKRRRELGQDLFDEVWEGDYHVVPAPLPRHGTTERQLTALLHPLARRADLIEIGPFNVGDGPANFRVPDGGYLRSFVNEAFLATAAVVVEIASPYDETYQKFGFYAEHGVDEIITVEPEQRRVRCWRLNESHSDYDEAEASALFDVAADQLTANIDWP